MTDQVQGSRNPGRTDILIAVVVLGSLWGMIEVVGGGGMKAAGIPYKGDVMTGLGIGIMAVALAVFRKPLMLIGIAFMAVAVRQLAVPIFHLPFMCKANSCLAVVLAGSALMGTAAVAGRRLSRGNVPRAAVGFSAGLLAGVGFYFIGMRVAPCPYLLSFNHAGGLIAFTKAEGMIWAALGALFCPLGYRMGERLEGKVFDLRMKSPAAYYVASGVGVAACWVLSGFAIASGF